MENKTQETPTDLSFKLPAEFYKNCDEKIIVGTEAKERYVFEGLEVDQGGLGVLIKGAMFPVKAYVFPEVLVVINATKALFMESIKFLATPLFIVPMICTFFFKKRLQKAIDSFNRVGWKIMSSFVLKDRYLTIFSRSLHFVIFTFLNALGITEESADRFATIFVHLVEYDNAYRLRMADMFSELRQSAFIQHPIKEVKRLKDIMISREYVWYDYLEYEKDGEPQVREEGSYPHQIVQNKVRKFSFLLMAALLIPSIRKAARETVKVMDLEGLVLDENDMYWISMRPDYSFMGMSYKERQEFAKQKGWTYPESEV